jgi:uncharacterized protein YcbK (DUF882 family)
VISPKLAFALCFSIALIACQPPSQSEFEAWQAKGSNKARSMALQAYLNQESVDGIIPLHQLLRSDVKWRQCGAEPFAVPPNELWPNMVPTLTLLRDEVQPVIGKLSAQSVFRDAKINRCIKGAKRSFHLRFHALDLKPAPGVTRQMLITKLCKLHREQGAKLNMGLGIYSGTRFHIDTAGYRGWGHDHRAATFPCQD